MEDWKRGGWKRGRGDGKKEEGGWKSGRKKHNLTECATKRNEMRDEWFGGRLEEWKGWGEEWKEKAQSNRMSIIGERY